MATTLHTRDYMSRGLANASPGVTDPVKDYVGRETADDDVDYLGRSLSGAGSISGTVIATSGSTPISGAEVTAGGQDATTDVAGKYTIRVTPGTYTVAVTADGFVGDDESGVTVAVNQHVVGVNFSLAADG